MSLDLPSLIAIHTAMMVGFGGLFAAISWLDSDWRFPWQFAAGFMLWPLMSVIPAIGAIFAIPSLTPIGFLSGFLGPALILQGAATFAGLSWGRLRFGLVYGVFALSQISVAALGLGVVHHLLALNVALLFFAAILARAAQCLPRADHRLGRPLIMLIAALTAMAQVVRLIMIIWFGWGGERAREISVSMVMSSTAVAVFGVAALIILAAERFSAQIRREARTDPLTGLAARRPFDDQIAAEMIRWRRYGRPYSLILFDLDDFKSVNDAYGHDVGDAALRHVAACGLGVVRPSDLFARLGGDEFALLLPESRLNAAVEVAERLAGALRAAPLQTAKGEVVLTGSFGVSAVETKQDTSETVVKRADEALYLVKRRGRDGVASRPIDPV